MNSPHLPRGLGWKPDDEALVSAQLLSAPAALLLGDVDRLALPTVLNYSSLMDEVPDQGATSSCVGQAFSTSLYLHGAFKVTPIPRPSAKLIYDFARGEDEPYRDLDDEGSRPTLAIRCLVEKGIVAERDWPLVFSIDGSSNVNERPPLDIYQSAIGYRVGSYYRIPAGPGASDGVRHALARGYFPVFAMPVDEAYMRWDRTSAIYPGRKGGSLGGHMQSVLDYGDGFIRVATSWGEVHGDRGKVSIASEYFDSGEVTDIIVCTMVPRLLVSA